MEWMTRRYKDTSKHATPDELRAQLEKQFRVLWARGIRTAFASKQVTVNRVLDHLFPGGKLEPIARAAIEGAQHTEYELRTVKKLIKADFAGKSKLLLTGVLDVVIQQANPLTYPRSWQWTNAKTLQGRAVATPIAASIGDLEIWDYKATKSNSPFLSDYVRQLLTYAALFRERTSELPKRCVLFFINEQEPGKKLLAITFDADIINDAVLWTMDQVRLLRKTMLDFHVKPIGIEGGSLDRRSDPVGSRTDNELRQQCTACGLRFDCAEYKAYLGRPNHPDIATTNVDKN
jgi:hypothetical protein